MSKQVQDMFSRIAPRYDAANDVLSLGIHRVWRRQAISFAGVKKGETVLDLCTGTGDFALALAAAVGPGGRVIGVDFVSEMISLAKKKHCRWQRGKFDTASLEFFTGDAMQIPLPADSVDLVSIGFGIRNVDKPLECLREIRRVLKDRGRILVLEFGQVKLPVASTAYRLYSRYAMPAIGQLVTGDRSAYEYLPETSEAFPAGESFLDMMREAGYEALRSKTLLGGLAYIYCGRSRELSAVKQSRGLANSSPQPTSCQ